MDHAQEWRQQKRSETHRRIYDAAMRLFQERGFEHVSVNQIATASAVSVPTFYAHFASKEHVVLPLPSGDDIAEVLRRQPEDSPLRARLHGGIRDWFGQFGSEEREELLARWTVVVSSPPLRMRAAEYERMTARLVLDALPSASEDGRVAAKEVLVPAYLSAVTAVFLAWAANSGQRTLEDLLEEALDALHSG